MSWYFEFNNVRRLAYNNAVHPLKSRHLRSAPTRNSAENVQRKTTKQCQCPMNIDPRSIQITITKRAKKNNKTMSMSDAPTSLTITKHAVVLLFLLTSHTIQFTQHGSFDQSSATIRTTSFIQTSTVPMQNVNAHVLPTGTRTHQTT
jgi:hypothetical protein